MLSLSNLTSYVPPVPIVPQFPDFALCHSAYGAGLKKEDGLHTGGILPYSPNPITYTVNEKKKGRASQYDLPVHVSYAGVKIAVQVAGPVNIESMALIPNDVRGMAAYLATFCAGRVGTGGFVTKSIQGLVNFVTDPTSDLGASTYPNSTAFVTVTMSSPDIHTSAGNYDPAVALVLQRAEEEASRRLPLSQHFENLEIADRIINYRLQAGRMRRLGALAWWDEPLLQGNPTEVSDGSIGEHSSNVTASKVGTSRRKKRSH